MKCAAKQGGQGKTTEGLAWGVSKRAMVAGTVEFCLRGDIFLFSFS
jgi:hypothetical protein